MRPSDPHLKSLEHVETLSLWWIKLLSRARQYKVRFDATTVVWDVDRGSSPSRSLCSGVIWWIGTLLSLSSLLSIYLLYPYHMLTLVGSSNSWYQSFSPNVLFVDCFFFCCWMVIDRYAGEIDLERY